MLFISNEDSATGAPVVLATLLQWLDEEKKNISFDYVTLSHGTLSDTIKKRRLNFFDLTKRKESSRFYLRNLFNRIENRLRFFLLLSKIKRQSYDLIYGNTVIVLPLIKKLKHRFPDTPVILHVHEMAGVIQNFVTHFSHYDQLVSHYIAPSLLVRDDLLLKFQISESKVTVIHETSPRLSGVPVTGNEQQLPFLVGAAGHVTFRKGFDLFIAVANYISTYYADFKIEFVWVGTVPQTERRFIDEEIRKSGLNGIVNFTGFRSEPLAEMQKFHLFLLPSREDPFPLVCLEAGHLGIPIICFKDATGIQEIKAKGVHVVPYGDVRAMSECIVQYYNSREAIVRNGLDNHNVFKQFHYKTICPQLYEVIEKSG